jgi:hypothetical protein
MMKVMMQFFVANSVAKLTLKYHYPYRGELEAWASSHNLNFHCDILKKNWSCGNVLALQEYNCELHQIVRKKVMLPKHFFIVL